MNVNLRELLEPVDLPLDRGTTTANEPPYLVYVEIDPVARPADNIPYHVWKNYRIEFYWIKKSSATEQAIENELTKAGIYWTKTGDIYITEQAVWSTFYYI